MQKQQRPDGAWLPLWFGNQYTKNHENSVYGTARELSYLNDAKSYVEAYSETHKCLEELIAAAQSFIIDVQNTDGSWGGGKGTPGSIEETALAISVLQNSANSAAVKQGLIWLDGYYKEQGLVSAPIGLYFASLWYDEQMYPLTMYLEAIARCLEKNKYENRMAFIKSTGYC